MEWPGACLGGAAPPFRPLRAGISGPEFITQETCHAGGAADHTFLQLAILCTGRTPRGEGPGGVTTHLLFGPERGEGRNYGSKVSPLPPQPLSPAPGCAPSGGSAGGFGPELDLYELGSLPGGWGPAPFEAGYEWGPSAVSFSFNLSFVPSFSTRPGGAAGMRAPRILQREERPRRGRGGRVPSKPTAWGQSGSRAEVVPGRGGPETLRLCPPAALALAGSVSGLRAMTPVPASR